MIEIVNIIFLLCFSCILLSNLFLIDFFVQKIGIKNLSLMDIFSINITTLMFFLLILSFFTLNLFIVLLVFFILSLLSLTIGNNSKINIKKNIFYEYLLFIIFCTILSVDLVANLKLEWDGHGWYFHALNFKENNNFFNLENLLRNNQPHLGGILWGLFWKLSIVDNEYFGRIFFVILYVTSISAVSAIISKRIIDRVLISSFLIFITYDKFLFGGYQEILMFSLVVIIINILHRLNLKKLSWFQVIYISLLSSLLLWTKNEGIFFFGIILGYLIYNQRIKKKIILSIFSLFLIILKLYLISINSSASEITLNSNLSIFNSFFFEKITFIFLHIFVAFFKYPIWIILLLILIFKKKLEYKTSILYFILSSIFMIYLIYLMQDYKIFKWMVTGSLDRIVFQSSGFIVIFVAHYTNLIFRKF